MEGTVRSHPARGPDRAWPLGQRLLSGDLFEAEKPQNTVRSQCLTKAAQGAAITGKKLPTKLVMTIGVPLLLLDLVSIVNWA